MWHLMTPIKKRRSQELARICDHVSVGGAVQQLVDEVKLLPKETREMLTKEIKYRKQNFVFHGTSYES